MIDENIEENLFSMLDEETDSEYVILFAHMIYTPPIIINPLRHLYCAQYDTLTSNVYMNGKNYI